MVSFMAHSGYGPYNVWQRMLNEHYSCQRSVCEMLRAVYTIGLLI